MTAGNIASREWWRRVFAAADRALELEGGEREAFIARCTRDDPALGTELGALLASGEAESPLDEPAVTFASAILEPVVGGRDPPHPQSWFGPYRILRELGRGGMGAVYLAERSDDQYQKHVALKILPPWSVADERKVQRFVEERQILAALEHPEIARLLDGGITPEGVPWFAMEFVEGEPIDRYCDERRLSIDDRLALFCRVCAAVQYAHRNLVVHRDLKPANILVSAEGRVALLDFGIAKLVGGSAASLEVTLASERVLTPLYASPEQIRGQPISTASDVYSLGVLLNVLLTGRYPYELSSWEQHEVTAAVLEQEPIRPSGSLHPGGSSRSSEPLEPAAAMRGTTPAKLQRRLQGDLDAIVLKALAKEPSRRYASGEQLQTDVSRHLGGLGVLAQPESRWYHARKFVRRHRAGVSAAAAVATLVLTFAVVTTVQSSRIRAQAASIALERDRAQEANRFLTNIFQNAVPGRPDRGVTGREILDSATAQIGRLESATQRAELMFAMARAYHRLNLNEQAHGLVDSSLALRRRSEPTNQLAIAESQDLLGSVLVARNRLAPAETAYREALRLRRRALGEEDRDVARTMVGLAAALRGQRRLQEAEALAREALSMDRRRPGETRSDIAQSTSALGRVLLDKGDHRAAAGHFRTALALVRGTRPEEHVDVASAVFDLAAALKIGGNSAAADSLVRYGSGLYQRLLSAAAVGGKSDASGTLGIHAPDEVTAAMQRAFTGQSTAGGSGAGAVPPGTGRIVFSSDRDGPDPVGDLGNQEIYVMNVDGSDQRRLTYAEAVDNGAMWSPDGTQIAFASMRDGTREIYLMNADGSDQRRLTHQATSGRGAGQPAWSPDGKWIAFRSNAAMDIYVISVDGSGLKRLTDGPALDAAPAWSPDGRRIAFASVRDGRAGIYSMDPDGGNEVLLTFDPARQQFLSWSPDGRRIAFNSERDGNREIYVMNADGSDPVRLTSYAGEDAHAAWSPDGRQLVFHRAVLGHAQIHVMNADGSSPRRLTELSPTVFNAFPSWGPARR